MGPLEASAEVLAGEGILLRYTDVLKAGEEEVRLAEEQVRGTHADEIETSMMLYIDPNLVNMSLAVREDNPPAHGGLTRTSGGEGIYSPSGVWGDATLATREKGEIVSSRWRLTGVDVTEEPCVGALARFPVRSGSLPMYAFGDTFVLRRL